MPLHRALLALGSAAVFIAAATVTSATMPVAAAATGIVTKSGKTLKVIDAFAFETIGNFGDPAIRIRLSDRILDQKALASVIDRKFELDDQRRGAGYVDIFVDRKTGTYQGATYQLGGSVSCAYCAESALTEAAKLRIEAGHVRGTIKIAAGSHDSGKGMGFDITLDVPVAPTPVLTPLANAAAGPEAKAFQVCRASVAKKDDAAKAACLSPDNVAMRFTGDPSLFWVMLRADDPVWDMTTLTVRSGRTFGDWVQLSIEGLDSGVKAKGVVYLRRMAGGVRYSHSEME